MRYVVLAMVLHMTAVTGKLAFSNIDPYFALFNFYSSEVAISSLVVLGVVLLASLFVERPWCKYACPYGAVLGITNLFRIVTITRREVTCVGCKVCDASCPMNIPVSQQETIRDHQCISCLQCTSELSCPVRETVNLSTKGGAAR